MSKDYVPLATVSLVLLAGGVDESILEMVNTNITDGLAVTCLQLGYLNTEDGLSVPLDEAALRGDGQLVPLHDVVSVAKAIPNMSSASYVRELVLPAIRDDRY